MTIPETDAFIRTLPHLTRETELHFRCAPDVSCFNRCCGDIRLMLSPYDSTRLRVALNLGSTELFRRHGRVTALENGFPAVLLEMQSDERETCPFVRPEGCSIYAHRPGACRAYPLGRTADIDESGALSETLVLIKEPHCRGFETGEGSDTGTAFTAASYLESQGLPPYTVFDDRYLGLMHRWSRRGRPLDEGLFESVFAAVYRPDELADFIDKPQFSAHPAAANDREERAETALLAFGFDWIEQHLERHP